MSSDRIISDAINKLVGNPIKTKVFSVDATVLKVDQDNRICTCQFITGPSAITVDRVRLMSAADDGLLLIPELGSTVCVIYSEFTQPYISQYSGIAKIIMRGGDLGGMVEVEKLTAKINEIIGKINNELPKISAGISVGGGTYTPDLLHIVKRGDYENMNIKQG